MEWKLEHSKPLPSIAETNVGSPRGEPYIRVVSVLPVRSKLHGTAQFRVEFAISRSFVRVLFLEGQVSPFSITVNVTVYFIVLTITRFAIPPSTFIFTQFLTLYLVLTLLVFALLLICCA